MHQCVTGRTVKRRISVIVLLVVGLFVATAFLVGPVASHIADDFSIQQLLTQRFPHRISDDIYLDPCKAEGFVGDVALPNVRYELEYELQSRRDKEHNLATKTGQVLIELDSSVSEESRSDDGGAPSGSSSSHDNKSKPSSLERDDTVL